MNSGVQILNDQQQKIHTCEGNCHYQFKSYPARPQRKFPKATPSGFSMGMSKKLNF